MDAEDIDAYLSSLPHAKRTLSKQGKVRYWLTAQSEGGHMFALMETVPQRTEGKDRPLLLSFCAGENYEALLEDFEFTPAPYLARARWVALPIGSSLAFSRVLDLLRISYNLTRSKLALSLQSQIQPL